jgi:hypothetical protein
MSGVRFGIGQGPPPTIDYAAVLGAAADGVKRAAEGSLVKAALRALLGDVICRARAVGEGFSQPVSGFVEVRGFRTAQCCIRRRDNWLGIPDEPWGGVRVG